ncbi:MAG: hypothetical protein QOH54_1394 [Mycobacterium sp.]|jgi:hypothetical protein|nr:hypothetical protein [Mycobacterium sp.]
MDIRPTDRRELVDHHITIVIESRKSPISAADADSRNVLDSALLPQLLENRRKTHLNRPNVVAVEVFHPVRGSGALHGGDARKVGPGGGALQLGLGAEALIQQVAADAQLVVDGPQRHPLYACTEKASIAAAMTLSVGRPSCGTPRLWACGFGGPSIAGTRAGVPHGGGPRSSGEREGGLLDGEMVNVKPEHRDCVRVAHETGQSVKAVRVAALVAHGSGQ